MTRHCTYLLALLVSFTAATNLHAQEGTSKMTILSSDRITVADSGRQTIIEGNAAIVAGTLKIEGADKIVLDKAAQKLTVYGQCVFTFGGRIKKWEQKEGQPATLEYKLGDDTVYIK